MEISIISTQVLSWEIGQRLNFRNRSTFAEVMTKNQMYFFVSEIQCTCGLQVRCETFFHLCHMFTLLTLFILSALLPFRYLKYKEKHFCMFFFELINLLTINLLTHFQANDNGKLFCNSRYLTT